jgi:hypothetical protein
MALPISPPPPVMSATRCASLPVCAISMRPMSWT